MFVRVQIISDLECIVGNWVWTEPMSGNLESSGELVRVSDGRVVPPVIAGSSNAQTMVTNAVDRVLCEYDSNPVVTNCVQKTTAHESAAFPRNSKNSRL